MIQPIEAQLDGKYTKRKSGIFFLLQFSHVPMHLQVKFWVSRIQFFLFNYAEKIVLHKITDIIPPQTLTSFFWLTNSYPLSHPFANQVKYYTLLLKRERLAIYKSIGIWLHSSFCLKKIGLKCMTSTLWEEEYNNSNFNIYLRTREEK